MGRPFRFDMTFFENDSADLWFAIGYLMGDGWLAASHHVCWKSTDEQVIVDLRAALRLPHTISARKPTHTSICGSATDPRRYKTQYVLNVGSRRLHANLRARGVPLNKSHDLTYCVIPPDSYAFDFIRGMLDSDGSTVLSGPRKSLLVTSFLASSAAQLHWIAGFLKSALGLEPPTIAHLGEPLKRIAYPTQASVVLIPKLYPGGCLSNHRKRDKAIMLLQTRLETPIRQKKRCSLPRDIAAYTALRAKYDTLAEMCRDLHITYPTLYSHRRRWNLP